jgi:two-component system response regulator RegX3
MNERSRVGVLVVEDEPSIRQGVCDLLAFHGYAPEGAADGEAGLQLALSGRFGLVVLDVMLPRRSGFEVCEAIRRELPRLPVLMLTARGAEEDVLRGFRCGSDDYVTKPFSVAELLARVEALLRRAGALPAGETPEPFRFGPWRIDPARLCATQDSGAPAELELTRRELQVLELLAREAGHIVSRRRLLREIWGYPDPDRAETRTVDMHVAKLRRKLDGGSDSLIETVRGEGYRYPG